MRTTRNMIMTKQGFRALVGLLVVAAASTATARSDAAHPPNAASSAAPREVFRTVKHRMTPALVVGLQQDVKRARALDARSFVAVTGIVSNVSELNARARGRKAPIALHLSRLGTNALMPVLEMLALDPPRGVPEAAAAGVRRDLIETAGLLKDARALPVLTSILGDVTEDYATTRTVTEAVARIGTQEAANHILEALEASTGDRKRAILAGMGECRHLRVTEALAAHLRSTNDEATARDLARALGRAGNSWAWQTRVDRQEEARIRETAARALVESFVRRGGEARNAASNALMVVDAKETPALLERAKKGASPELARELDALAARFANNPSRANRSTP